MGRDDSSEVGIVLPMNDRRDWSWAVNLTSGLENDERQDHSRLVTYSC